MRSVPDLSVRDNGLSHSLNSFDITCSDKSGTDSPVAAQTVILILAGLDDGQRSGLLRRLPGPMLDDVRFELLLIVERIEAEIACRRDGA